MWDDVFGAIQFSLDARAPPTRSWRLLKGKLSDGFVPNMWMPNWISFDRSGPPIGGMAPRLLYERFQDDWIVELLFDDCLAWVDWFWRRSFAP